jgi:hypothetical protein
MFSVSQYWQTIREAGFLPILRCYNEHLCISTLAKDLVSCLAYLKTFWSRASLGLLGIGLQCTMQKPMNGNCHQVVVLAESVVSAQWFFGSLQLQQDTKE